MCVRARGYGDKLSRLRVFVPVCVRQALLLHGSLPEDEQGVALGFGETCTNAEQQMVPFTDALLYIHTHTHTHLCQGV